MTEDTKKKWFLLPFAWLYGLATAIRNKLFDWRILPSEEFPVPVISVGNIAAGGTGKTPHTEYLIRLLSKKYKVATLSRGYKRKSRGFVLANAQTPVNRIGDEPYQFFRKFPNILVAVDANRRRGIKKLLQLPEAQRPEVILLDDAFQHRYVAPSLSILLTESRRLLFDDALLPVGRLRESWRNMERADCIIVTKCSESLAPIDFRIVVQQLEPTHSQEVYFTSYRYKSLLPVFPDQNPIVKESIERLKKESCSALLLAGIANPDDLIAYLQKYFPELQTQIYPDHHSFTRKNMNSLTAAFSQIGNARKIIITTEKDAMRLLDNPLVPDTIKPFVFYLPVEVAFNNKGEELFIQKIEKHVENFKRNRIMA